MFKVWLHFTRGYANNDSCHKHKKSFIHVTNISPSALAFPITCVSDRNHEKRVRVTHHTDCCYNQAKRTKNYNALPCCREDLCGSLKSNVAQTAEISEEMPHNQL